MKRLTWYHQELITDFPLEICPVPGFGTELEHMEYQKTREYSISIKLLTSMCVHAVSRSLWVDIFPGNTEEYSLLEAYWTRKCKVDIYIYKLVHWLELPRLVTSIKWDRRWPDVLHSALRPDERFAVQVNFPVLSSSTDHLLSCHDVGDCFILWGQKEERPVQYPLARQQNRWFRSIDRSTSKF